MKRAAVSLRVIFEPAGGVRQPRCRLTACPTRTLPRERFYNEYVFVRFLWAMGTYAVLATLAAVTLDGKIRLATWIFLGGLAIKTVIAYKAPR